MSNNESMKQKYLKYKKKYQHLKNSLSKSVQTGGVNDIESFATLRELKDHMYNVLTRSRGTYDALKTIGIVVIPGDALTKKWQMFSVGKTRDGSYIFETVSGAGAAAHSEPFYERLFGIRANDPRYNVEIKKVDISPRKFRYLYESTGTGFRVIIDNLLDLLEMQDSQGMNVSIAGKIWRPGREEGQCGKLFNFYVLSSERDVLRNLFSISKNILMEMSRNDGFKPFDSCAMNTAHNFIALTPDNYNQSDASRDQKKHYSKNFRGGKIEYIVINYNGFKLSFRNDNHDLFIDNPQGTLTPELINSIVREAYEHNPVLRIINTTNYTSNDANGILNIINGLVMEKMIYDRLYRGDLDNPEYRLYFTSIEGPEGDPIHRMLIRRRTRPILDIFLNGDRVD